MEIRTSPHRPASTPWWRLLLLVVALGPVIVLVLLPAGLGLQRYVMTSNSMQGGIDRGAIVLERVVPVSDLRVGDVITYRPPDAAEGDGVVTHRIVAIGPDGIVTRGDARPYDDPWTLHPQGPTMSRVVLALPWVGWAHLLLFHPLGLLLAVGSGVALVALTSSGLLRRAAPNRREPDPRTDETAAEPAATTRIAVD